MIASVLDQLRSGNLSAVGEHHRRELERSQIPRDLCFGGSVCHDDGYATPDSSPCEIGSEGLGIRERFKFMVARRPWTWWKGSHEGDPDPKGKKGGKGKGDNPKGGKKGNWNNDRNWQTGDGRGGKAVQDWADSKEQGKDA